MGDISNCLHVALKKYWGYSNFKPHQFEICTALLNGRDGFVVMATGTGKSLCYQCPPLALHEMGIRACSLVICPLISLMEDQVLSLRAMGVAAGMIGGTCDASDEYKARMGEFSVLYLTPEKLEIWHAGLRESQVKFVLYALPSTSLIACQNGAMTSDQYIVVWGKFVLFVGDRTRLMYL